MKKLFVGALGAFVAVLGFGALTAPITQAVPTAVVAVNCTLLTADAGVDCSDGVDTTEVADIDELIGDDDGELTADDLETIAAYSGGQLEEDGDSSVAIFVFVDDDDAVTFDPKTEVDLIDSAGVDPANIDAGDYICNTQAEDEDCDGDGTEGDGVVVAVAYSNESGDVGDEVDIDIEQESVDEEVVLTLVGNPDSITIGEIEETVTAGGEACEGTSAADDGDDLDKLVVWAIVSDGEGNDLAGVLVEFTVDDEDIALIDAEGGDDDDIGGFTYTVAGTDAGTAGFATLCGQDAGEVEVTAEFDDTDNGGEAEDASATKMVVGEPANVALTASPAAIDCDGTASSTVSATVTDADGNNVVDGTSVNFSVVALGIANPINAETADGVASSTITPLSAGVAGVTVIVTAGDEQASIRVDCNPAAAPTTAPGASPTPGTGIAGPDTGNGGYLGQDSSAGFPMWTLVALTLGAVALAAGGMVTNKVTR